MTVVNGVNLPVFIDGDDWMVEDGIVLLTKEENADASMSVFWDEKNKTLFSIWNTDESETFHFKKEGIFLTKPYVRIANIKRGYLYWD